LLFAMCSVIVGSNNVTSDLAI